MKIESKASPRGWSDLSLTLTFESIEELIAFQARMSGYVHSVEHNPSSYRNYNYSYTTKFGYEGIGVPSIVENVDFCKLADADHVLSFRVNDVVRKHIDKVTK